MMKKTPNDSLIVLNRKARFNFFLEEAYEAGVVLMGWEVKSLRAGKVNISDAHIIIKNGEAFLLGAEIQPLPTASTHSVLDHSRSRKLLLKHKELKQLVGKVERQGYTLIPLSFYWQKKYIKMKFSLAKGKKTYDKRETIKERDWQRQQAHLLKRH